MISVLPVCIGYYYLPSYVHKKFRIEIARWCWVKAPWTKISSGRILETVQHYLNIVATTFCGSLGSNFQHSSKITRTTKSGAYASMSLKRHVTTICASKSTSYQVHLQGWELLGTWRSCIWSCHQQDLFWLDFRNCYQYRQQITTVYAILTVTTVKEQALLQHKMFSSQIERDMMYQIWTWIMVMQSLLPLVNWSIIQ